MPFRRGLLLFTACTAVAVLHPSLAPAGQPASATGDAASDTAPKVRKTATARTRKAHKPAAHPAASTPATGEAAASGTAAALPAPFRVAEADTGVVSDAGPPVQVAQAAQSTSGQAPVGATPVNPGSESPGGDQPLADIEVRRQELLLKQKDVPSAITEIGQRDIQAQGNQGSTATVLEQSAPSINVYQSGPGQSYPVISVRGVRGQELATTLDGIPIQDLTQGGVGQFLAGNIGAPFDLEQTDSVTVYPGVAPPGVQGYGTIGGTLAYKSRQPTNDMYLDVFGSYGSFHTDEVGFVANTGRIDDLNGFKALLAYSQTETGGYIDNTNAKFRDMQFAFDQPYGGGLSHLSGTVIYNNDLGFTPAQPVPLPYLEQNGPFWNFPKSTTYFYQKNDFLTAILNDETVLDDNDDTFSLKFFLLRQTQNEYSYQNPDTIQAPPPGSSYYLFAQNAFNFYGQIGPGTNFYRPPFFTYDPSIFGNPANGAGENSERVLFTSYTYGVTPDLRLYIPVDNDILPFNNSILVGGLFAKETTEGSTYFYGLPDVPAIAGYNQFSRPENSRVLYQGYFQDKIDALDNTLHIEPGVTYEGALGQVHDPFTLPGYSSSQLLGGAYTLKKWSREILPYVGASYDLPYDIAIYGSYGKSALYAPLSNYTLGTNGLTNAPGPALLNSFEGGIRYNTEDLYLNLDYFYQKETRAFGFFQNFLTGFAKNTNLGVQEFKGVEAAVKYKITDEVSFFGNAGYLLNKYLTNYAAFTTIALDQFGYAFKGTYTSGVPDWTATFGFDYDKKGQFLDNDEVFARFFGHYTGRQFTTIDISPFSPQAAANPQLGAATVTNKGFPLDPFTIFNLDLQYTLPIEESYLKHLKFDLNLQNLFDVHYSNYFYNQYTTFEGSYFGGGQPFSDALPGPPFSATFTVTARFGPGT